MTKTKIFISHASEDKAAIAKPLADALQVDGFDVWYDEYSLTIGDSLKESIEEGITLCDFGAVIVSSSFLEKEWPKKELNNLFNKEIYYGKTILPIWHKVTRNDVAQKASFLLDKLAANSDEGIEAIVKKIRIAATRNQKSPSNLQRDEARQKVIFSIVKGSILKELILEAFIEDTLIDKKDVSDAHITMADDLSGLDLYCHFELIDGSKIPFDEIYMDRALARSQPVLLKKYHLLEWEIADQEIYGASDSLEIENVEICTMFVERALVESNSIAEKIHALKKILQADIYSVNYGSETWRFTSELFNGRTICWNFLNDLFKDEAIDAIKELIFDRNTQKRFTFIISRLFIEYFMKHRNELDKSEEWILLIGKIGQSPNVMNDYWKAKIEKLLESENKDNKQ